MRSVHRIVTIGAPGTLALVLGLLGLGASVGGVGCAGEPPRPPHALTPIPEQRARELIGRTFQAAGIPADVDRVVYVGKDRKRVRLEVAAAGRKFGVAYLTSADWAEAGDALPPRSTNDVLVIAVGEGGIRILCLFASDYGDDDQTGDNRTAATVAADRRLERDVRDFLHHAEQQSWP